MSSRQRPLPLFDSHIEMADNPLSSDDLGLTGYQAKDYHYGQQFLLSYHGNAATFNAYRRETERLLQWSWLKREKSVKQLRRTDIEAYLKFCEKPLKSWIGIKKVPRFVLKQGIRQPNPQWRPFVVTLTKTTNSQG